MWNSLFLLAVLATLLFSVSSGTENYTEIIISSAQAASGAGASSITNGDNGNTVAASSAASAASSSLTIIKSSSSGNDQNDSSSSPVGVERTSGSPDITKTEISTETSDIDLTTQKEYSTEWELSSQTSTPEISESWSSSEPPSLGNNESSTEKETDTMGSTPSKTSDQECIEKASDLFIFGNLRFTASILNEQVRSRSGNVMCCGLCHLYTMSQMAIYATGRAKKQILNALNFINTEQILCYLPQENRKGTAKYRNIEVSAILKIYADKECRLTEDFTTTTKNVFYTPAENIDFSSPVSARHISYTIAKGTNNIIRNYIKPKTLSSSRCLIMADAFTFKGSWEKPFNPDKTTSRNFYCEDDRTIQKPTMYQRGRILYTESKELGAQVFKFLKEGGKFSFAIFLPYEKDGLQELTKRMQNPDLVAKTLDSLRPKYMDVYVPKFKLYVANKPKSAIEMANVTEIFNRRTCGLQDISDCRRPYVSEVYQKLFIEIDELGLGASPQDETSAEDEDTSSWNQDIAVHKINHSFVFYAFFEKIVLLAGTQKC